MVASPVMPASNGAPPAGTSRAGKPSSYDACSGMAACSDFRDFNPGGVFTLPVFARRLRTVHESRDRPAELPAAEKTLARGHRNPDYKQYINLTHPHLERAAHVHHVSDVTHPGSGDGTVERAEGPSRKSGSRSTRLGCLMRTRTSFIGRAQHSFRMSMRRRSYCSPVRLTWKRVPQYHDEIIRWYDHC